MLALDLAGQARETVGRTGGRLVARAASFMLLADSRASFQIEGERPPRNRLERWGRAVLQAGKNRLTLDELIRLHGLLVEDTRFVRAGLRPDGVFLGERNHSGDPFPEFIGARAQDLAGLMAGMLEANDRMRDDGLDPVPAVRGDGVRVRPCASLPGRQRPTAPLPDSSRSCRTEIHAGRHGISRVLRDAPPH